MEIFSSDDISISHSEVSDNVVFGILITNSNITLASNDVLGSEFGIHVEGSSKCIIECNEYPTTVAA